MRRVRRTRSTGAKWFWSGMALVLFLIAGLYLSLPYLVQQLFPRWLESQGISLRMEEVQHDILAARVVLRGVSAGQEGSLLTAEEVVLALDLGGLFSADLRLDSLEFLRGEVAVRRAEDRWWIAGLTLDRRLASWAGHVGRLAVVDVRVRSDVPGLGGLRIEQGNIQRGSVAAGGLLNFRVAAELGDGRIAFSGEAWPVADDTALAGELTLQDLALERLLAGVLGPDVVLEEATADARVRVDVLIRPREAGIRGSVDGRLRVEELRAEISHRPSLGQGLVWRGEARFDMEQGRVSSASFQGRTEVERWEMPAGETDRGRTPLRLEDGGWEGRLEWSPRITTPAGMSLVGDVELGWLLLGYGEDRAVGLEQVFLWGVERGSGKALQVGRVQARRVVGGIRSGGTPGLSMGLGSPRWRTAGLEMGLLELHEGSVLRQRFVEVTDLELLATAFDRAGGLGRARVEGLEYSDGQLSATSLALHDLELAANDLPEVDESLVLDQALFLDIAVVPSASLSVGESRLSGLRATAVRDAEGQWRLPVLGGPTRATGDLRVALGTFRLEGASRMVLVDPSSLPPYRLAMDELRVRLASWDSHRATDSGRFSLESRVGEGGRLTLNGRMGPLLGAAWIALHGEAIDLPLGLLPPGLLEPLGMSDQDGALAAWFDLRTTAGGWAAYADLQFSGLGLARARPSALDGGLRLLQDDRAELRLALELDGQADSALPRMVIERGAKRGIAAAILDYYGSLGVAPQGARSSLQTGRLSLAPVSFLAGSASFDREAASHLEAVADRLQHRPLTRLRVCAHAIPEDFQRATAPEQMAPDPAVLKGKALALAGLRDRYVREHLTRRLGLPEKRLLPCAPAYQLASKGTPWVDLSLEVVR